MCSRAPCPWLVIKNIMVDFFICCAITITVGAVFGTNSRPRVVVDLLYAHAHAARTGPTELGAVSKFGDDCPKTRRGSVADVGLGRGRQHRRRRARAALPGARGRRHAKAIDGTALAPGCTRKRNGGRRQRIGCGRSVFMLLGRRPPKSSDLEVAGMPNRKGDQSKRCASARALDY